jgi:hypothetical protein
MGINFSSRILIIGFVLVLAGFVLPFLMVLHVIQASLPLCFASYAASVTGLLLGMVGIAWRWKGNSLK